jgi:pyruvate kinase
VKLASHKTKIVATIGPASESRIDNAKVQKIHIQGNFQQTLAGADQGLKTLRCGG